MFDIGIVSAGEAGSAVPRARQRVLKNLLIDAPLRHFSWNAYEGLASVRHVNPKMDIEQRRMPETEVAYIRHFGPYGLEPTLKTLGRLLRWARSRGLLEKGRVLGVPWNNPHVTPPEECCYDACITVDPEFQPDHPMIGVRTLAAGLYLVRTCRCREGDLETPWQEFLAWYRESEWEMADDPCFEIYTEKSYEDESGNWSLELWMPVRE